MRLLPTALAVLLLAGTATAQATPGVDEPPPPGTPRALQLPAFEEARLANGLRVVVAPRPALPLVSVVLHLAPGAAADPEGRAGLSSLAAQLRTRGATRDGRPVGAIELARQAEVLGAALEAGSSWGGHSTAMTVARTHLDAAAALVVDVVRRPLLAADELERLRAQVADGLKIPLADPMQLAGLAASRGAWGASVFGGSTTPASLARITLADVQALHRRQARPEAATLVLAGDITLPEALALAQRLLGDWTAPAEPPLQARAEPPAPQTPATVLVNLPGSGQSGVVLSAPAVAVDAPERRVAQLAAAVLGGGYSARLNREVRIKRGLSYGASAGNDLQASGGVLKAAAQTKHASAAEVAGVLREQLLAMAREAPSAEELAARQATLVGSFGRQLDTTAGLASTVLGEVERGRPLAQLARVVPEILAVTPEQVRAYAQLHWRPETLRTTVVGDLAAAGEPLKALDRQAQVIEAPALDLASPTLLRQP